MYKRLIPVLAVAAAPIVSGVPASAAPLPSNPSEDVLHEFCERTSFKRREIRKLRRSDGFPVLLEYTLENCPGVASVLSSGATSSLLDRVFGGNRGEGNENGFGVFGRTQTPGKPGDGPSKPKPKPEVEPEPEEPETEEPETEEPEVEEPEGLQHPGEEPDFETDPDGYRDWRERLDKWEAAGFQY